MIKKTLRGFFVSGMIIMFSLDGFSQRYLADFDSLLFVKDTLRPVLKRFENLQDNRIHTAPVPGSTK